MSPEKLNRMSVGTLQFMPSSSHMVVILAVRRVKASAPGAAPHEHCRNVGTIILVGTVERGERKRTIAEVSKADDGRFSC